MMSALERPEHSGAASDGDARPAVHPVIGRERVAIEEELLRARELLRDGMDKLHGFFDTLRSCVGAQSDMLAKLTDDGIRAEERAAMLQKLSDDTRHMLVQSETAILGLQLEDVLGQLLDYTRRRADGLSNIAATLAEVLDEIPLNPEAESFVRLRTALADADRRAEDRVVSQESLGTGDIELF